MNRKFLFNLLSFAFLTGWSAARAVEAHAHAPGLLGVALHEIMPSEVERFKLPGEFGAWVEAVAPDSPAESVGIQVDDVIVGFNGERVLSARALRRMVYESPAGRTVELRLIRDGRPLLISVKLGEGREMHAPAATPAPREPRRFGAWIEPVQPQLGEYLGLPEGAGMMVTDVQPGSPADRAGVQAKDILAVIEDTDILSAEVLGNVIQSLTEPTARLEIIRNGARQTLTLRY